MNLQGGERGGIMHLDVSLRHENFEPTSIPCLVGDNGWHLLRIDAGEVSFQ